MKKTIFYILTCLCAVVFLISPKIVYSNNSSQNDATNTKSQSNEYEVSSTSQQQTTTSDEQLTSGSFSQLSTSVETSLFTSNVTTYLESKQEKKSELSQKIDDPISNHNDPIILSPPPSSFTLTPYYNSESPLGIAGSFHIVGFDEVVLNAHTNGNILANKLHANANFGTNNITDELSYILNYTQVNSGSASSQTHVLVVGNSNSTDLVDNGNAIAINGRKLDKPKIVWKDGDTEFIDLNTLKNDMQNLSQSLSATNTFNITENLNSSAGSVDESYIELTDSNSGGVYNTTATELSSLRYFGIKGLSSSNKSAVVINVDCEEISQLNLPISLISVDGNNLPLSETTTFINGRVLWNFYNYLPNTETSITASLLHGSILAEGIKFNATQNLNGTIIADDITISAESHRDDFISDLPTPITNISIKVNKLWFNSDKTEMETEGYSAVFQLFQDDVAYGTPITLDANNEFSYTFYELSPTSTYTLQEVSVLKDNADVSDLFELTTQTNSNDMTLINTLKEESAILLPETGGYSQLIIMISTVLVTASITFLYLTRRKI